MRTLAAVSGRKELSVGRSVSVRMAAYVRSRTSMFSRCCSPESVEFRRPSGRVYERPFLIVFYLIQLYRWRNFLKEIWQFNTFNSEDLRLPQASHGSCSSPYAFSTPSCAPKSLHRAIHSTSSLIVTALSFVSARGVKCYRRPRQCGGIAQG